MIEYDVAVVGSGASGMMAAIVAARRGKSVAVFERQKSLGVKLKATGGGRCNLTNRLSTDDFMVRFGKHGRFMSEALRKFNQSDLCDFFHKIGVETHAPDGYRVFPKSHNSQSVVSALIDEMKRLNITILCGQDVSEIVCKDGAVEAVKTPLDRYLCASVIVATGGLGYARLGASLSGYNLVQNLGHTVTDLYPAMLGLICEQSWVQRCRCDTVASVQVKVDLKKRGSIKAVGDLIFTKDGIRGPVVLDIAREITPLLDVMDSVPLLLNFTKGKDENELLLHLKSLSQKEPQSSCLQHLNSLIPNSLAVELCQAISIDPSLPYSSLSGKEREKLVKTLAWTPLDIVGHEGFERAMVTRGGVSLKEIDPRTMMSKIVDGLYMCGEVLDIDGPCGGYNLQYAFSSGYLAATSL